MEHIILLVFKLNIESSYINNIEQHASDSGDTVQFILLDGDAWRVKTYSIDHDVHVWNLGKMDEDKFLEVATSNTEKNYGDVLSQSHMFRTNAGFEGLKSELSSIGLPNNLEVPKSKKFCFWVSEPNIYKSKSSPK